MAWYPSLNKLIKMADSVKERLERRRQERLEKLEQKRTEKETQSQPEESNDYFSSSFKEEKNKIENMLKEEALVNCTGDKVRLTEHFDSLIDKCQRLQKFLADSSLFLPSHAVKSAQSAIDALQQTINDKRDEYIPKKKFAFSSRKKAATVGRDQTDAQMKVTEKNANEEVHQVKEAEGLENFYGFRHQKNQTLIMSSKETTAKDVHLTDLTDCTIKLYGALLTLHINKLQNCEVFCGPVSSSIFVDNCKECTFVLACQQLRVHTTFDTKFYLYVTSNAIVEDCQRVGFAAFNWDYKELIDHFEFAGIRDKENNWALVKDFNWLRTDVPSPNWYIIPEDEQTATWAA